MTYSKFEITGKNKEGIKKTTICNNTQLIDILLNFAGGGWTTSQTVTAMTNRLKLIDNKQIKLKYRNCFYMFKVIS